MAEPKFNSFFEKHYSEIESLRKQPGFSWEQVVNQYQLETKPENLRTRYKDWRKKYICTLTTSTTTSTSLLGTTKPIEKFAYLNGNEDRNKGTKTFSFTADYIPNESEIIEHFNIDTKKFRISQIWHKTSFGGKYAISVNLQLNKESLLSESFEQGFRNFCEKQSSKCLKPEYKFPELPENRFEKNATVVINLADLHLGKLVSESETGERYNIDIAKERFLTCIKYLAYKSYSCYGIKKFILSSLGDTLHTDTVKSTTTSGTYVESDTRASKVFEVALEVLTESIDILKQFADQVEFININGNHCELSEQHLGIALKAYYRNDNQVVINASPKVRKSILVGDNLLSWTHGDTNMNTLPLTIATEVPELWGRSKFRLVQLGHLHGTKKKVFQAEDEFNGVIVRHFSSLSGTDSWHNKNNYVGNQKRGTALVFLDNEVGIVGEFYKTI